ncbi:MAG: DNA polymerase III subunit beta [Epulopiscium sp. Nuni2H_MBin001]|nr:MAG: DNA polymerase III subunit beta [Epulopiscium sp. Nuni2H_MBin001]
MKFCCDKDILLNALNTVYRACSSKTAKPILECILIKSNANFITLTGNNLELGIETTIEVDVIEAGEIALEAKLFLEIVRKLSNGDVEVTLIPSNIVTIISGKSKFSVSTQNPKDFPTLPEVISDKSFSISKHDLKEMIRQTIFSVAQDDSRPIFTGEMFEIQNGSFNLVSVDGFRISYRNLSIENKDLKMEQVVPGKTLQEIAKILNDDSEKVKIYFGENHVLFDLDTSKVISRLLEGEFLKYNQVFSNDFDTQILINRIDFLMSIERAALISREGKKTPVCLDITDENIIITSNTEIGTSREELEIELTGNPLKIAFNPKFLIDALKIIEDEKININFLSKIAPAIIQPLDNNSYKYLVLPIRINE